ncbi:transcription antitermination factor NusB [Halovulum dunhuangense]|uniref:Transcription antitermination protein NusB n=1 Tax=Halovulum dunhuangense TaxID=1505036 RepID=A0A849L5X4_9RHOB|nr:transcription antitermination factor NusB [Halovulum dunhuangense]NNU81521.1 transcription antitermination factor NusB [Halovulum dunhuangense]
MAGKSESERAAARQARSAARLYAVQALFQMEASDASLDEVQQEFETHRFGAEIEGETWAEGDVDLFRQILREAVSRQARIDKLTDAALVEKWPIARIDPTIRALFRAAGAEMLATDTPPKVAINEYVDIAKAFFPGGKESRFVNAVLDHMAREIKPDAFA